MKERLDAIKENALSQIKATDSLDKLNDIRVAFLGKKGELTEVLKGMKEVAPEDRPKVGQIVNGRSIRGCQERACCQEERASDEGRGN